ncbi:MAG: response regulator transcription factor [Promicromonosporaceae bacterium]|nr:response regulator transcription factor [Promicromonosporaceae bacterium]
MSDSSQSELIRIVVADDHPVVRSGLVAMLGLEPDFEIVGEADDGAAAVRLAAELNPDVVLTDLRMPGMDGVAATREIVALGGSAELTPDLSAASSSSVVSSSSSGSSSSSSQKQPPRVLVLTTYDTDADILRAVEAGATGYLLKDTPLPELVAGIRKAARGETVLAPSVATRLVSGISGRSERLTEREAEVLELVSDGFTNAAIAAQLHIGESTVKTHLLRVYGKLGVNNRTEAVTEARHRGWVA